MLIVAASVLLVLNIGPRPWLFLFLAVAILVELTEKGFLVWYTRRIPIAVGAEAMIGLPVTVVAACRPAGRVRLGGESWKAQCVEGAGVGERLVIDSVENLSLVVSRPSA